MKVRLESCTPTRRSHFNARLYEPILCFVYTAFCTCKRSANPSKQSVFYILAKAIRLTLHSTTKVLLSAARENIHS